MKIKTNRIGRKYGEFVWKDLTFDDKENEVKVKRKIEITRWKNGNLTIEVEEGKAVISEKELIEGIKKIPKTN
jgi:hypothetical protein